MARHLVAPVDQFPSGTRRLVHVDGRPIAIFNVDGSFYALRDLCPHQGASLSAGVLTGAVRASQPGCYEFDGDRRLVRCPWHGWEYDLSTGQSWYDPAKRPIRRYPVSVTPGAELTGPEPGPYIAETFPISIENDYIVLEA